MNKPIRIVIADDHDLVRQGIRSFVETHADLAIVGEASIANASNSPVSTLRISRLL